MSETLSDTFTPPPTLPPDYSRKKLCVCRDTSCLNCSVFEQRLAAEQLEDFILKAQNTELDISLMDDAAKSPSVQLSASNINLNSNLKELKVTSRGDRKAVELVFPGYKHEKIRPRLTMRNIDCHMSFTDSPLLEEKTAAIMNLDLRNSNVTVDGVVVVDFLDTDLFSISNLAVVVVYQCDLDAWGANRLTFRESGIIVQSNTLTGTILSGGYPEIEIELMNGEITLVPTSTSSIIMNNIELELNCNTKLYAYGWSGILNANALEIKHGAYEINVTTDDSASAIQFGFDGKGDVYVNGILAKHMSHLSNGAIAGIVISCVAFVLIVVAIILAVISEKKKHRNTQNHNHVDQELNLDNP